MPIPCQGFTVSWGGQALQEVQTLDINRDRGLPLGRTVTWTPNWGTIEIAGFSTASLPESEFGRRKALVVQGRTATSGPVVTWFERDCIYENARIQAIANDAVRFAFTFRVQDTLNAPSNP